MVTRMDLNRSEHGTRHFWNQDDVLKDYSSPYTKRNCDNGSVPSELRFTATPYFKLGSIQLASCLIHAQPLLEYLIFIMWLRSVIRMLPSVKFAEGKVLTYLILREKC